MTFPLHRGDYLSLFDRLDTSVSNVIDAKKDPDLLRKATGYLSRNPNVGELLIRVSDEFEVSAFTQSPAPNRLWNIHAFSTVPPVTSVLQQRSEIVQVVSENGHRINHEYEVLRVRKVHEVETPIRVQLDQVIVSEHRIMMLTQDPLAGLISNKDIVRISGVHPALDARHLIDTSDQCKLTAENTTSMSFPVLDVNSRGYCAMEATVDNRTVIYRIRRKQNDRNLSMSPVLFQGGSYLNQRGGYMLSPSTPSPQDAVYSLDDTRQQEESSEGHPSGGRGTPHEVLLLPKCEKHPELQEKIRQITAPVFIENLVKEVGLKNILRVCKNHLFGLEETKEAFDAAFAEVEAEERLLKSGGNKEPFHETSSDLRTNQPVLLLEETRETFDDRIANFEISKSLLGTRKVQELPNDASRNLETKTSLLRVRRVQETSSSASKDQQTTNSLFESRIIQENYNDESENRETKDSLFELRKVQENSIDTSGTVKTTNQSTQSKEPKAEYNDTYAALDTEEHFSELNEADEAFDDLPDDALYDLRDGDFDDLPDDAFYDFNDDEYAQFDHEEHYFEEDDRNELFDDDIYEDYEIANPVPATEPAPAKVSSSMVAVNRANRLLGITQSPPPPRSSLGNKAASSSRGTPPPLSNRVSSIGGPSSSRGITPHKSHSFEEIINIIREGIRTKQARTLYLCHERNDALEIQTRFIECGIDANLRKRGKLNKLNFHRDVAGCFVLIVNVQVALNLMEDIKEDLFSFFAYIVEPVNLNTASCLLRTIKNKFYQVERPSTQVCLHLEILVLRFALLVAPDASRPSLDTSWLLLLMKGILSGTHLTLSET